MIKITRIIHEVDSPCVSLLTFKVKSLEGINLDPVTLPDGSVVTTRVWTDQ